MAIKNRFFKTTQGVPYEFVLCNEAVRQALTGPAEVTALATTTFSTFVANAGTALAFGDCVLLHQDPSTGIVYVVPQSTNSTVFRTGIYKTWPHMYAWCVNASTKQFYVTAPFIPEKCDAIERYAYTALTQYHSVALASSTIPVGVNQELYFKVIETTPGNLPAPIWDYTIQLNSTMTEANAWSAIAQLINYGSYNITTPVTSGVPKGGEFFTASAGATSITITASASATGLSAGENALAGGRTFRVVAALLPTKADPVDYGVTFTATTTPATNAIGLHQQVEDLYQEATVRQGVGNYYTGVGYSPTEMGIPTTLAAGLGSSSIAWSIYKISGIRSENSKLATGATTQKFYIFAAVRNTATAQDVNAKFHYPLGGASYNV